MDLVDVRTLPSAARGALSSERGAARRAAEQAGVPGTFLVQLTQGRQPPLYYAEQWLHGQLAWSHLAANADDWVPSWLRWRRSPEVLEAVAVGTAVRGALA